MCNELNNTYVLLIINKAHEHVDKGINRMQLLDVPIIEEGCCIIIVESRADTPYKTQNLSYTQNNCPPGP